MNELEARRLKLLDEIGELKAGRMETHEKLVEEIRSGNARLFEEGEKKLAAQRAELERLQGQIVEADEAKRAAEEALAGLTQADAEKRLGQFALTGRAAKLIARMDRPGNVTHIGHAKAEALSAGELISRVRGCFEDAGHALDNDAAVNLLACLALSPVLLLSGPAGSGKSATAALLADALGLSGAGRCVRIEPSRRFVETDVYRELTACADAEAPLLALLDDINLHHADAAADVLLSQMEAPGANPALRLLAAVQDAPTGLPVRVRLLDRAFMIRLRGEAAETDWAPRAARRTEALPAASEDTLKTVFAPQEDAIPDAVLRRMQSFRTALGAYGVLLSRRTLDATWNYCAAAAPLMQRDAMAVLDLAIAQRALPSVLAVAPLEALHRLPELLEDMPESLRLLSQPLPLEI